MRRSKDRIENSEIDSNSCGNLTYSNQNEKNELTCKSQSKTSVPDRCQKINAFLILFTK